MTEEQNAELLRYINETPEFLSLLYDMDLLPEQCKEGTLDRRRMNMLAWAWRAESVGLYEAVNRAIEAMRNQQRLRGLDDDHELMLACKELADLNIEPK